MSWACCTLACLLKVSFRRRKAIKINVFRLNQPISLRKYLDQPVQTLALRAHPTLLEKLHPQHCERINSVAIISLDFAYRRDVLYRYAERSAGEVLGCPAWLRRFPAISPQSHKIRLQSHVNHLHVDPTGKSCGSLSTQAGPPLETTNPPDKAVSSGTFLFRFVCCASETNSVDFYFSLSNS